MKSYLFLILFLLFDVLAFCQEPDGNIPKQLDSTKIQNRVLRDSIDRTKALSKDLNNDKALISDYLIISHSNDTTFVDTTLTINKYYKFNYLRKDNFELLAFSNLGQTYNNLGYSFFTNDMMPGFAAQSKHFNYMQINDLFYYHVPTPLTELLYKTPFEQGNLLDAFFTVNTSKQFNFSIAYKGERSIGKYQHIVTSSGNFRFTTNYKTKNNKYFARAHIAMQDILNEENGGLKDDNIEYFESGNPEFLDRAVLDVNFQNAEGILKGKRFYLDQTYKILEKDTISKNTLNAKHIISFNDKYYQFTQSTQNNYFGEGFRQSNMNDKVTLENLCNRLELNYYNQTLGDLQLNVGHNNYNYGYDKVVVLNDNTITNRLKGNIFSVGGNYNKQFKNFKINGELGINVSGDFDGNYFRGEAVFNLLKDLQLSTQIRHLSKLPNYNKLLYQSDYINYNWNNNFNTTEIEELSFKLISKRFGNLDIDYSTINDYTYFAKKEDGLVYPFQNDGAINYLKVKYRKEFKVGHFFLDNTIMYQKINDENQTLNLPEVVTRNTLYYSNHFFKNNALYLQTGVTFNYFTEYNMNAYDPLLSEFYVQNEKKYGAFPRFDFFVNAKVRQTRIYLIAEHFNSAWTGYNFYSAPNYPYRDFVIRFGLVWNFFL
ncbi:putative porin [Yeosuana sp. MJ-SS3]|uniref:Porin n=1 Tax=Gilvirhabdus luticola TaxID=3079858 RepID=A0ABU3U4R7_9FLAO|nr:putative porin [Yeosuana sp. MJ-SS3]MDU8885400.1 putative porin [Yeosuana sp. MJ-SS3]